MVFQVPLLGGSEFISVAYNRFVSLEFDFMRIVIGCYDSGTELGLDTISCFVQGIQV